MDQMNDTFPQEITQAPPENPMYAGGIAVLVAFVLFMYWGSLNEKDDTDDEKKEKSKKPRANWLQGKIIHGDKKRKRKDKQKGVYSVSDAMSKHLLEDTGQDEPIYKKCDKCRYPEHNMQLKATSSNFNGAHIPCRTSKMSNKTERSASCNRVGHPLLKSIEDDRSPVGIPRKKRAHSSPEIVVINSELKNDACTCVRSIKNGENGTYPPKRKSWVSPSCDDNVTLVRFCEQNCERTSEFTARDSLHFEKETKVNRLDLDRPLVKCKTATSCGVGPKANGKVLRQLDDASVRLESHPNVAIAILAESVI
ncbi:uncharacterized protein LOC121430807 [Lytechinus variegatus]|uniref:uncharacterized protein LOC121430807 n=1 Tax=Lytechinus variegatus TaxID=7654 RepID=UPI001BB1642D|nr:uncharacterized protein LOC121430807 [Lytechinus variegatus]